RVALAILMAEHSNTLILDEPTNHLDLQSKETLEKSLVEFEGTLLFVSHDRYFLNTIPTKIIELQRNGLNIYDGNFDFYLEQQSKLASEPPPPTVVKQSTEKSNYRSKQERAEQTKIKSRLKQLEELMESADEKIALLESDIASPDTASDYAKLGELCAELEKIKLEHDGFFAEWAELCE
ncbi:MAG: ABC transporter, partial [Oscillospiraceae bacterium]